ncbi:Lipopolysaccharide kinase, partial [mine drainage metagenome]
AQMRTEANSAIVFDPARVPQVDARWFDAAWWQAQGRLRTRGGGRGGVGFIDSPAGALVLRHFRRGGLLARVRGDRYLWLGTARSRGFREFALLQWMRARGLPVPEPLAARCVRTGWFSARADLLSAELPAAQTLAERLRAGALSAADCTTVGALLARFHQAGVYHADLNAHNILWSGANLYLIDFDRGRVRKTTSPWQRANLERLQRSLLKVAPDFAADRERFARECWQPLLRGYDAAMQGSTGAQKP